MACSSLNRYSASAFASSVLPTPVVPRKMNEPMGLRLSCRPALERLMASEIASMASSCPATRLCSSASMCKSFSRSLWIILVTGTPVQRDTIPAISSAVTSSFNIRLSSWVSANCFLRSST